MIRIAIVEDEKLYQEQLTDCVHQYMEETGEQIESTVFSNGEDITEEYAGGWDLIFLDIKMKSMDGISTAKKIRECDPSVLIIFVTTMAQYAIRGYEVDALDFVLKPMTYAQFRMKMMKAVNMMKKKEVHYVLLPDENGKRKIATDEILFVEVQGHYLNFVTKDKLYCVRDSMKRLEKELQNCYFARCSNSFLINLKNVDIQKKDVILIGNREIALTRSYKKQFLQQLSDFLGAGYQS